MNRRLVGAWPLVAALSVGSCASLEGSAPPAATPKGRPSTTASAARSGAEQAPPASGRVANQQARSQPLPEGGDPPPHPPAAETPSHVAGGTGLPTSAAESSPHGSGGTTLASAGGTPPAALVDFRTQVLPILETHCQPCHFEGGPQYERMPFDRPQTIRDLGEKLFTRIRKADEQALIRSFLAQPPTCIGDRPNAAAPARAL